MAELKCKDGTVIQISNETEQELRRAFEPKPSYKDINLKLWVGDGDDWPIHILSVGGFNVDKVNALRRNVEDTEAFIKALQKCVDYCKQHNLGT